MRFLPAKPVENAYLVAALLLPITCTIWLNANLSAAPGWLWFAAAGTTVMIGIYLALAFRPLAPAGTHPTVAQRRALLHRRRVIDGVYLGSIVLRFALLFWDETKALRFSFEQRTKSIPEPCAKGPSCHTRDALLASP